MKIKNYFKYRYLLQEETAVSHLTAMLVRLISNINLLLLRTAFAVLLIV